MTVYQDQYHMADFTYDDYEKIVITQKGSYLYLRIQRCRQLECDVLPANGGIQ